MNIEINESHWYRLKLPQRVQYNFWDFLHLPKCRVGEVINFVQDGTVVGQATVSGRPKELCRCKMGKVKYRVHWRNNEFKDLRDNNG